MKNILLLLFLIISFKNFAQAPTTGLVGYWPMNGNFNDASGNGFNATNVGATATNDKNGTAGGAMQFSNPSTVPTTVAQYALLPTTATALNFTASQDFSLSFWFYANAPFNHNAGLFDNNLNTSGYGVWYWNTNGFPQLNFNYRGQSAQTTNGAFTFGTWVYVCCVKNSTSTNIYINGVLNATKVLGTNSITYPIAARFGSMSFTGFAAPNNYNGHEGKLDEFRIYNRALTAAEISNIFLLPVKLANFSGRLNDNTAYLNWQTAQEINAKDYYIQRSIDGVNFENIGVVKAVGNSSIPQDYTYEDNVQKINGTKIYYRLQQNDIDGRFTFSNIIILQKISKNAEIFLYPNPAIDKMQVQVAFSTIANATVEIVNTDGKIMQQEIVPVIKGSNNFSMDISRLTRGSYFIKIYTNTEKYTKTFIKR